MNVRRYKCPIPRPVSVAGRTLDLRPLSQHAIDHAIEQARTRFTSRDLDPVGDQYELEEAIQTLAAASRFEAQALRSFLYPNEVWRLYSAWACLQVEHTPDLDKLGKHLKWGVACDEEIAGDGVAAYQAQGAADFYGAPIGELTFGQLAYYLLLRIAYQEIQVSEKKVTRRWLEQMRQSD